MMTFEEFVIEWTGRDMDYHTRNRTTGLEFAAKAWEAATKAEREECAELCESFDACDTGHIAAAIRARAKPSDGCECPCSDIQAAHGHHAGCPAKDGA